MQIYKAPLDDFRFLFETFGYDELLALKGYADFDLETAMAILDEGGRFCANELLPLNRVGDQVPLRFDPETGDVRLPDGCKAAYDKFCANGMLGIVHPAEYGGTGAPAALGFALGEMITATNKGLSMCPGLTHGLIEALMHYGSDEQKATYLEKLVTGEWSGTMCLTEPHCGTDLGLLRTRAVPEGDHFRLTGSKIWISFGEHDLTENIIHLVLARLPDAPEGIKGISTFIVPKFLADGTRNGVVCGGLDHKMGIKVSPTCVINMDDAVGYLVGTPHKGMRTMFVMMNHARLSVGMEGIALSDIAYQTALAFCRDRIQSRALDPAKRDPDQPADNILVHPDVRRMLLNIKASTEGMRALAIYVGVQLDIAGLHPDEARRQRASDLVALLTPIIKSYCSERGFHNISEAMQATGGAGYTSEWSIEQYLRDERIAMIYEGTNHIQALDLVGRKLPMGGGRLIRGFAAEVTALIRDCADDERLAEFVAPLKQASKKLTELTMALGQRAMADPEEAGAAASNYLNVFALTALAFTWVHQAKAAIGRPERFYQTKLKTARYFFHNVLPEMHAYVGIIQAGKQYMMAFDADEL